MKALNLITKTIKILILLPIMAVVELILFLTCLTVAKFNPKLSSRMTKAICSTIPNLDWYFK